MKKKTALIAGLLIISIGIIILSLYWPPVDEGGVAGTFKKSDKYQEDNVNKDDIILDSELMKDSNQVNKLIADLVQFGEFSQYLKAVLNQFWLKELEKSKSIPEINSAINQIRDFNNFIDNNNEIIQGTIVKFIDYNFSDKKQIDDMESQLKQLQNYVAQFLARDSLFEFTIRNVDLVIKNRLVKQDQINNLKNLRDRFVIDEFLYGLKMGDTTKVSDAISQDFYNPKTALKLFNFDNLGLVVNTLNQNKVSSYWDNIVKVIIPAGYSQNQINVIVNSLNAVNAISGHIGGNGGNGGFFARDTYFSFNQESLGFIFNHDKLNSAWNSEKLNSGLQVTNLGTILNTDNLKVNSLDNAHQIIIFNDQSTLKMFNQIGLGILVGNGPVLQLFNTMGLGLHNL